MIDYLLVYALITFLPNSSQFLCILWPFSLPPFPCLLSSSFVLSVLLQYVPLLPVVLFYFLSSTVYRSLPFPSSLLSLGLSVYTHCVLYVSYYCLNNWQFLANGNIVVLCSFPHSLSVKRESLMFR